MFYTHYLYACFIQESCIGLYRYAIFLKGLYPACLLLYFIPLQIQYIPHISDNTFAEKPMKKAETRESFSLIIVVPRLGYT